MALDLALRQFAFSVARRYREPGQTKRAVGDEFTLDGGPVLQQERDPAARRRLFHHLLRRGFSSDAIAQPTRPELPHAPRRRITEREYAELTQRKAGRGDAREQQQPDGRWLPAGPQYAKRATGLYGDPARWNVSSAGQMLTLNALSSILSCAVYNSTSQTVNNGVTAAIDFDSERFDPSGMHSIVTSPSRITIATAGKYMIGASVSSSGATSPEIYLQVNRASSGPRIAVGDGGTGYTLTRLYQMAAADYIELVAVNNTGGSRQIVAAGNYSPELWCYYVGP